MKLGDVVWVVVDKHGRLDEDEYGNIECHEWHADAQKQAARNDQVWSGSAPYRVVRVRLVAEPEVAQCT